MKTIVLATATLLALPAVAVTELEQCAVWHKQLQKYEEKGEPKYRRQIRELELLLSNGECPAQHEKYLDTQYLRISALG